MRYAVIVTVFIVAILYMRGAVDPTLLKERRRPGGPTIDKGALRTIRLSALATLVVLVADLAVLHWSNTVPPGVEWGSIALIVFSLALLARSMAANRFFSSAIRVQAERGHHVVSSGPYAIVRHPGYLGMICIVPAVALAAGSWTASAVGLVYSFLIARRVAVEDRFLREHLEGYDVYAQRVRYRLVPGVW